MAATQFFKTDSAVDRAINSPRWAYSVRISKAEPKALSRMAKNNRDPREKKLEVSCDGIRLSASRP